MNWERLAGLGFFLAFGGLILSCAFLYNEAPPEGRNNQRRSDSVVKRGENLEVFNSAIFDKSCPAVIYRAVYDSNYTRVYTDTEFRPSNSLLGEVTALRRIPIPAYTNLGPAQYRVIVEWQCNFIQRLWPNVRELPVLNFLVVDKLP